MLNGVSFLRTYCRLHVMHSKREMAYSVLQFVLWNIFQVLFVCWLLNVVVVFICLQNTFPAFDLHSVHLPSFKVFKSFLTLSFFIQCVPIISWIFLFCLNAVIGSFLKIYWRFSFTCKIFQFFLMVLAIFCRILFIEPYILLQSWKS